MNMLIVKLGATGDVVRTTTLLGSLPGEITWLTEQKNTVLLQGLARPVRCFPWEERDCCRDRIYDLVINLEDTLEVAKFASELEHRRFWGACLGPDDTVGYTKDARDWFDLSIISQFGREQADALKLANRATYQELIFRGLAMHFSGQAYCLPPSLRSELQGDVAIASEAGPVWPMKKWAYYDELRRELENAGFTVNVLPKRLTLLDHLADVRAHRCLVSGDTLPMHFALGSGVPCVSIFTCTSPWEIHDYGLQRKIISPRLEDFFYRRGFDVSATTAIEVSEVFEAVMAQLDAGVRSTAVA